MAGVKAAAVVEDRHTATGSQQLAACLLSLRALTCQALYSVLSPSYIGRAEHTIQGLAYPGWIYPGTNNHREVCWQCTPGPLPRTAVVITSWCPCGQHQFQKASHQPQPHLSAVCQHLAEDVLVHVRLVQQLLLRVGTIPLHLQHAQHMRRRGFTAATHSCSVQWRPLGSAAASLHHFLAQSSAPLLHVLAVLHLLIPVLMATTSTRQLTAYNPHCQALCDIHAPDKLYSKAGEPTLYRVMLLLKSLMDRPHARWPAWFRTSDWYAGGKSSNTLPLK